MAELAFEERFAELRSLSQQAPDRATFKAALDELEALAALSPERFEDEALPYAAAFIARWYAANPLRGVDPASPFLVPRDRAIKRWGSWLAVVRELELDGLRSPQSWYLLRVKPAPPLLARLEALSLRGSSGSAELLHEVLRGPLMAQLAALSLERVELRGALAAWTAAPPALRALELRGAGFIRDESHMALARMERLERLGMPPLYGMARKRLLEAARWPALHDLTWGDPSSDAVFDAELGAGLGAFGGQLERLEVPRWGGVAASAERLVAGAGSLQSLRVRWSDPAHSGCWPIDEILATQQLRELGLYGAQAGGAIEGGARLERLWLTRPAPAVISALRDARGLSALRELTLEMPGAPLHAACEALADAASFGGIRALSLRFLGDGAPLRALCRASWIGGVETLKVEALHSGVADLWAALLAAEDALGAIQRIEAPRRVWELLGPLAQGTWLEGKLACAASMEW